MAELWDHSPSSASARSACNRSPATRSTSVSRSSANSHTSSNVHPARNRLPTLRGFPRVGIQIVMPKLTKHEATSPKWDSQISLMAWLATCVSVLSFLFYFRRGEVLLYGDAVAHINIARRVFDSRTPGLLQLGTVWLPLPHLLMIPFLISDQMWRTGVGGSISSMTAYVFGVVGMFRLLRGALLRGDESALAARITAWTAAAIYAANPSLIYMQATAMGEALYLAFFIWTVVYFSEFVRGDARALTKCGWCLAAACLTRYDGWFLAAVMVGAVAIFRLWRERNRRAAGE